MHNIQQMQKTNNIHKDPQPPLEHCAIDVIHLLEVLMLWLIGVIAHKIADSDLADLCPCEVCYRNMQHVTQYDYT